MSNTQVRVNAKWRLQRMKLPQKAVKSSPVEIIKNKLQKCLLVVK